MSALRVTRSGAASHPRRSTAEHRGQGAVRMFPGAGGWNEPPTHRTTALALLALSFWRSPVPAGSS